MTYPSRLGERPDNARPRIWWELLGGLVLFALYILVDSLNGPGRIIAATRNGRDILAAERAVGIPVEEWLNDWLARHPDLQTAANYEYAFTYIMSALALLIWLYIKRPATYRWARNSFIVLNLIAMACFVAYPAAPPRLLASEPFYDTVLHGRTWGSWGSPLVENANQMAAMPSLHIAWAVWVSIVLACISGARWIQGLSAVHVLLTALVVMATANHYLLDVVAGAVLVWITVALMGLVVDQPGTGKGERLAPPDAFFLYAESTQWPQHVGGLIMFDEPDAEAYQRQLRASIREHLDDLPRFRQRLRPGRTWQRPRWQDAPDLDWEWHTPLVDLAEDGRAGAAENGRARLDDYVASLQREPMPRDRPLWRFITVCGFAPDEIAGVLMVHHCVADGIGTIEQAMQLIEPPPPKLGNLPPAAPWWRRAAAITAGLARLATDGGAGPRLPSRDSAERGFRSLALPLDTLRDIARHHEVRLTDVLMSVTAGAVRRVLGAAAPATLRVTTPLMVRAADSSAEGNLTAAVMMTVPLDAIPEPERLVKIGRISRRTERTTRALASRFVMNTAAALLPPPAHAWFARTVYGFRFFQAIVSNMPGPVGSYRMAGGPMIGVYPILPLARRAPIAIGALSWDGTVYLGISIGPDLVTGSQALTDAAATIVAELHDSATTLAERAGLTGGAGSDGGSGGAAQPVAPDGDTPHETASGSPVPGTEALPAGTDGARTEAARHDGAPHDGARHDAQAAGSRASGTRTGGPGTNGARPDTPGPNGSRADGSGVDGSGADGSGADGSETDEPGAVEAEPRSAGASETAAANRGRG